jgi:hypothetical protein
VRVIIVVQSTGGASADSHGPAALGHWHCTGPLAGFSLCLPVPVFILFQFTFFSKFLVCFNAGRKWQQGVLGKEWWVYVFHSKYTCFNFLSSDTSN